MDGRRILSSASVRLHPQHGNLPVRRPRMPSCPSLKRPISSEETPGKARQSRPTAGSNRDPVSQSVCPHSPPTAAGAIPKTATTFQEERPTYSARLGLNVSGIEREREEVTANGHRINCMSSVTFFYHPSLSPLMWEASCRMSRPFFATVIFSQPLPLARRLLHPICDRTL